MGPGTDALAEISSRLVRLDILPTTITAVVTSLTGHARLFFKRRGISPGGMHVEIRCPRPLYPSSWYPRAGV